MITHSRETYQPTSIMRWDRGIFNGSIGISLQIWMVDSKHSDAFDIPKWSGEESSEHFAVPQSSIGLTHVPYVKSLVIMLQL